MSFIEIPINVTKYNPKSKEVDILNEVIESRTASNLLLEEHRAIDALERTVKAMQTLREFPDFEDPEFQAVLTGILFDLAEIHFQLKDYKQSEKELDVLFNLLEPLIKKDAERFAKYHILAMELSTRILRSRKKTLELLVKHQVNADALYEKVNAGLSTATDKLVDSLRNVGQLLAATGDNRAAMKFYAEAIKFSKKRAGRVTRKEVKMTIEMAEIMMRVRSMRPRAIRLLNAILTHAIALETVELEEEIRALLEVINSDMEHEIKWKTFFHKLSLSRKKNKGQENDADSKLEKKEE